VSGQRTGRGRLVTAAWVAAGAVLVAAAVAVPERGAVALTLAEAGGAAVVAVVLARRGLLRHRVGAAVLVILAVTGLSSALLVVLGPGNRASLALIVLSQVVGLVALAPVLVRHRPSPGARWGSALVGAEQAIFVVGVAAGVLQACLVASRAAGGGAPAVAATAAAGCDVLALGVVVWLALTRTGVAVAAQLLLAGTGLMLLQNLLSATWGVPIGSPGEVGQPLGVLGALLLAAAGSHPSVREVGDPARAPLMRSGATRVVVLLPFGLAPAAAWAVGVAVPQAALPAWGLLGASVVVSVLALVRAFGLVAEAERQADTDVLTGGLGRRGGLRRLEALHAAARPTWVCLIDLDSFTEVNQRHGQEVGDALLRAVLARLGTALPPAAVVARLGGDEVLVLAPAPSGAASRCWSSAEAAGEAVLAVFAAPFEAGGAVLRVSASVGVTALTDADGRTDVAAPREALGHADLALRAAKARGGGRALGYRAEMREEVLGPLRQQRELRALLQGGAAADRVESADGVGRLAVEYQPVVDLQTGQPLSVEALVRWDHPVRGRVSPAVFLPLAEAAGVGAALDRAVMRQAMHQVAAWDALGVGVARVGVNLGRDSMRDPHLLSGVRTACADAGVALERLVLEITEHDEIDTDAGVVADLLALHEAGASIALDDFGAGHASVGYLRRWPVDVVKLDRSLLPGAAPTEGHPAMIDPGDLLAAVGALVHALDRHLLVEGIEDEGDLAVARAVGAQYGQGYHFARPMPPDQLAAWWRERAPALERTR
jgi:diguanylate cyclase (GGDEF)-like protein